MGTGQWLDSCPRRIFLRPPLRPYRECETCPSPQHLQRSSCTEAWRPGADRIDRERGRGVKASLSLRLTCKRAPFTRSWVSRAHKTEDPPGFAKEASRQSGMNGRYSQERLSAQQLEAAEVADLRKDGSSQTRSIDSQTTMTWLRSCDQSALS